MTTVVLDHLASRWDRSWTSLRDDVDRSDLMNADVITLTEVADGKRDKAFKMRKGWSTLHRTNPWQAGEVAMLVRNDFGRVMDWKTTRIGPDLGPGNEVYCIVAVIKIWGTGETILVADSHMPSAVEGSWLEKRGRLYRMIARNYRDAVADMRRKWKPDAECVWADWNLNLSLGWVRGWAVDLWNMRPIGKKKMPKKGSHHTRLIDWPVTRRLRKRKLRVMPMTPGSDHRGVRLIANIKKRKKS